MTIGSTAGGPGHVIPDDPDHRLVTPEDTVAIARMEEAASARWAPNCANSWAGSTTSGWRLVWAPGSPR